MHSHECSAPQSPGARTVPRASGLETSRFRAQSTFRRVRNPHRLRGDCYVACVRGVPSRPPRTYPFAFSPQRSAFSTLRRFLLARHSLGTCPREPAPEWCRDTSNRRLPPSLLVLSSLLHPCSRRSNWLSDSHPFHSRGCPVHAGKPASAGPLALSTSYSLIDRVATFASCVSCRNPGSRAPASQPNARDPEPPRPLLRIPP
jgi:hypothetical protein